VSCSATRSLSAIHTFAGMRNLYDVLGVAEDATLETIKTVYRQLARTFHPDVNSDDDAVEHFREITDAFVVLSDPDKRVEYDAGRASHRRCPIDEESETSIGLQVAGIDLGGILGVHVRVRRRALFADPPASED